MATLQTKGLLSILLVYLQNSFAPTVSGQPAPPSRPECYIPCDETNCGFSISCTWDPGQDFQSPTNYTLHWEPANSGVGHVTSRTSTSGVIPREHFSSHSKLRVWVQANNQDGSVNSLDVEFNTKDIEMPPPPKVTLSQHEPSEVYWTSPCNQQHFSLGSCDVRYRTEGGTWEEHSGFLGSYTFDSLQPCTTYELQVRCYCDVGLRSNWSEIHRIQGTGTAPSGKLDVRRDCGTCPTCTDCVLTWKRLPASQTCGLILGYEVRLSYSNGNVAVMNVSTAGARCDEVQCRFTCSLNGASSVNVSAYNAHGSTVASYLALPVPAPLVPSFNVSTIAATQVILHWEPVSRQDGLVLLYQIGVDKGPSGSSLVYNQSAPPLHEKGIFTLTNLNPGQEYEVWIRSVTEAGPGEKVTARFKTNDSEDFAHWPVLLGILFVVAIVAVFILYCVCRGENKERKLVPLCFYEKVPDPRNSHIFRQMKHQINDHMAWICIPTSEPQPKISILEVVDSQPLASKSSFEKTSDADGLTRPVVRQGSSQLDCQADQREHVVTEDCHRKENKCGREAYSKMIDSDEERDREEEDREGCWSSSEEEQCTVGYEKHFMPTASDILEVS